MPLNDVDCSSPFRRLTADVIDLHPLAGQIKQQAKSLGFSLVGICKAEPSHYREYFRQWLDDGQAGTMDYLKRRFDERVDPSAYLPGAQSVICVAFNYHAKVEPTDESSKGCIAKYALGDDYHDLIKPRLHKLSDWLRQQAPGAQTRCSVDTAPVMEKELAARAGVGWIGKNTCIINQQIGSWLFLGEVLTTLDLPADDPVGDRCGTCTRCIDSCPTQAITAPYQLDARRCISYLNIEHRGDLLAEQQAMLGDWLYGCDVCQDVCPWNHKAPLTDEAAMQPRFPTGSVDLHQLLNWSVENYRSALKGSAMKRVKLPILQRNARIVQANLTEG